MPGFKLDSLLELLEVRLEAFAICEIDRNRGLACPPMDSVLVHFVIEGEGAVECEHGRYALRPGHVLLVPRNLAKRIEGPGPIFSVVDVDQGCPLAPGLVKFRASASGAPGLVLACGSISVGIGGVAARFDELDRPILSECNGGPLPLMFEAMAAELRRPAAGTKAMVEALMRQVLVVLLRGHLTRRSRRSSLHPVIGNPQLGRAVEAIVTSPGDPHSVDNLAALAGMTRSSFNRHFSATYGCSPMDFVQTARLRAAARMLAGSDVPVKSIAAAVGYGSRSHFSRAFARRFGTDPSSYRSSRDLNAAPPPEESAAPLLLADA